MRKRLVRALVFVAVAVGAAVGASPAAGALDLGGDRVATTRGITWD